jgi:hypothetical protein
VFDTDVMVESPWKQLIFELDRVKSHGFGQGDRSVYVRRITPTAARVENDRQSAHASHPHRYLRHLWKCQVGFGYALQPPQRSATQIDRFKTGVLGEPRHDRIERNGSDDEVGTFYERLQAFHPRTSFYNLTNWQ